ncbi:O-antigen ligase family protein [bacterium]|nr:O-antigen ligase family protein [bacterium]
MTFSKIKAEKLVNILLILLAVSVPLFARSPNINKYLLILLVIAWFIRGKVSFKNPVALPIGVYVLIVLVSAFAGVNFSESFRYFVQHTVNIIMVFVVADCVKDRRQHSGLLKVFLISASVVCVMGLLQYAAAKWIFLKKPLEVFGVHNIMGGRICSTRRHPLVFADNIALYLPLMAAYAAHYKKALSVSALVIMMAALIFTYSRTPTGAVFIVFAAAAIMFFKKTKAIILPTAAAVIIALLSITFFKGMPLKRRLHLKLEGRQYIWKGAEGIVKKYPLFGVGQGNVYDALTETKLGREVKLSHTHNTYLQILVASGIFALITFFWVIYAFFKELLKRIKHPDVGKFEKYILVGLLFGFAAEGMCGMTDDLFCRAEIYYPIYFLMGLAMSKALDPDHRVLEK